MRLGTTLEREDYYLRVTQRLQSQEAREDAEVEQEEQDQTLGTIPSRRILAKSTSLVQRQLGKLL